MTEEEKRQEVRARLGVIITGASNWESFKTHCPKRVKAVDEIINLIFSDLDIEVLHPDQKKPDVEDETYGHGISYYRGYVQAYYDLDKYNWRRVLPKRGKIDG